MIQSNEIFWNHHLISTQFHFLQKATECANGWTLNFVKKFLIVNFLHDDEVGLSKIGIISGIHQN